MLSLELALTGIVVPQINADGTAIDFFIPPLRGARGCSAASASFATATCTFSMGDSYRITLTNPLGDKEEYYYNGVTGDT